MGRRVGGWVYGWMGVRMDGYSDAHMFKEEVINGDNSLGAIKQR